MLNKFFLLLVALLFVACGSTDVPATGVPTRAAVVQKVEPTATATVVATAVPTESPTVAAATVAPTAALTTAITTMTDWVNTASVDGDFFVRGNPSAPIRMVDYSDFL